MDARLVQLAIDTAAEFGVVAARHDAGPNGFVVALEDDPVDVRGRRRLASILGGLVNTGAVQLVGVEGAFCALDTTWLGRFPDDEMRSAMCESLFEVLALSPGEYCHVFARRPFSLVGLEDKAAYRESLRLWDEIAPLRENIGAFGSAGPTARQVDSAPPELCDLYPEVIEYGRVLAVRAEAMVTNLIVHMDELGDECAAVVASGPILDLACDDLLKRGVGFAWIEPGRGFGDLGGFEQRLLQQAQSGPGVEDATTEA